MTMLDNDDQMRAVIDARRAHVRGNWTSFAWVVLIGLVIAGGAALISSMHTASSSAGTVNSVRLEKQIKPWAVDQGVLGSAIKVECPSGQSAKAGTVFECLVSQTGKGARSGLKVAVTIENAKGDATWVYAGGLIGLGR
jgi:hypothetical protein